MLLQTDISPRNWTKEESEHQSYNFLLSPVVPVAPPRIPDLILPHPSLHRPETRLKLSFFRYPKKIQSFNILRADLRTLLSQHIPRLIFSIVFSYSLPTLLVSFSCLNFWPDNYIFPPPPVCFCQVRVENLHNYFYFY